MSDPMVARGPSAGFVYFAFGEPYMDEMAVSAATLLEHNPGARICLITDEAGRRYVAQRHAGLALDQVRCVVLDPAESFWVLRMKICELSPYQRTIYLDDDTYVAGRIDDLFDLLETFDFVAVPDESHPARGFILGLRGGYAALNYYNCGFFMFRNSPAARQLFEHWREEYLALAPLEPADQGALVRALVRTPLRFITLPKEYNLRLTDKCVSFQRRVKVIHGRARDHRKLISRLNDIDSVSYGSRVWIPNLQRVIKATAFVRYAQLLSLFNLDHVRRGAMGAWERGTVRQNVQRLAGRLLRRRRAAGPAGGGGGPDAGVLAQLMAAYGVRSTLAGHGLDGPSRAADAADVVWWHGVPEQAPPAAAARLIEALTCAAVRCVVLSLIPTAASRSPAGYSHPGFQTDWSWTQLMSDHGFYFDPYRTLEARARSRDPQFQQTGLVFERVGPAAPAAEAPPAPVAVEAHS